jgi:hypothetical protein
MSTLRARDIIADVRKVVARRPLSDFLDAAALLQNSPAAPTQPFLVHLSMQLAGKAQHSRKAKVMFEDDVEKETLSADETLQQQRAATKKKALLLQESLDVKVDAAQDVHDYFAVKSLVEWLPQSCFVPTVEADFYESAVFKATKSLEVTTIVQEQLSAQSETAAGFVAKVSRTKMCTRRPESLHHWGCRHAIQMFLRAALDRREAHARCDGGKAGRLIVEQSPSGAPMLPAIPCRYEKQALLDGVTERTQLPYLVIPLLHLQCRALLKDKKLLRDPHYASGVPDDATSRAGSLSRTMSIASDDSGPNTRPTSSSSHSDTKSAVSGMTSGGGRKAAKLQHVVFNEKLEYWIGLKGLVFRISFDKCPPGRAAYYRAVLLPIFSGRECTFPFLALTVNFNSWDFLSAKERTMTMQRTGASMAAPKPILSASGAASVNASLETLLSKEQKIHIDRIFALFLADFDLLGELEGYAHYWF